MKKKYQPNFTESKKTNKEIEDEIISKLELGDQTEEEIIRKACGGDIYDIEYNEEEED